MQNEKSNCLEIFVCTRGKQKSID